jgi:hypothetical protein
MDIPASETNDKPEGFDKRLDALNSRILAEYPPEKEVELMYGRFVAEENWPPAGELRDAKVAYWVAIYAAAKQAMTKLALTVSGQTRRDLTNQIVNESIRVWPWYVLFGVLLSVLLSWGLNGWIAAIATILLTIGILYLWS